jgi:hypothetical protein
MQQLELCDVRVLKFVHQDVPVTLLESRTELVISLQQRHGLGDQPVQCDGILLAQQFLAGFVRAGDFLLQRHVFRALFVDVLVEDAALRLEFRREIVRICLVVAARYQLVLAAREKRDEVAQKLPRLRQAAVFFQLQARHVSPQQNPVIYLFEGGAARLDFLEQRFAKGMKRRHGDVFAALTSDLHHPRLHLSCSFLGERQRKDVFSG